MKYKNLNDAKEIERLIYGNGIYEVVIFKQRYGIHPKWWIRGKENYPFYAETLKKEFEKYDLKVHISDDKLDLSVERLEILK
ncbi:hypothetical protein [Sulfurimonas sp.]|jgi:hypothetical protein|uniref:hypothetical protein n=1 Tax=Sulfurimonas sp. TaxID=2022749 RepID=UPI0025E8B292|nr:hypothetical protein [Sulfurimonas sp.]MCK9473859.1 hypothetical protein [Sulfurimonas sp.]